MSKVRVVEEHMTLAPASVQRGTSAARALSTMSELGIRHLPVLDGERLLGVVAERELKVLESMESVDSAYCLVEDMCIRAPYAVAPKTPLLEVARNMAAQKIGSAVVVEGTRVVGIFTLVDSLRVLAELLEAEQS